MANALRFLAADAVERAGSGHPGMPLGMADIATVLFTRHLRFDAGDPAWPDRDRFVLSNGHGSMLLYGLLHLTGYPGATLEEVKRFRRSHAAMAGHPEYRHLPGIETTSGPLGQGIATAVGMALAERMLNASLGDALVDHRTYVFCGDGCLMEGVSQEALSLAGHLKLSRLIVIFDDNSTTIDGATSLSTSDDQLARFRASGWHTLAADGHDHTAIDGAIASAKADPRPSLIAARTRIGFGAPGKEGTSAAHGSPLGAAALAGMRERLGWPHPPFEVPADIAEAWREAGRRGRGERLAWQERLATAEPERRREFERRLAGTAPARLEADVSEAIGRLLADPQAIPIRQSSRNAVGVVVRSMPEIVGGSADLTGSVLSRAEGMVQLDRHSFSGAHIGFGVREHGMAAALNGMALHGGFVPYGGTYLTFSDYCRPAIRLAALMGIRVIFLFSHDSIGVGEDGPTHQPIEHIASLRAMPGLRVYRPADGVEALECWEDAVTAAGPSVMIVARQAVPQVRTQSKAGRPSSRGGYVLAAPDRTRDATLLATGSEVSLALEVRRLLRERAMIEAAVVSMPCWERFEEQDEAYRDRVLGPAPRFAIEAASPFGWERYTGDRATVFGVPGFGFSGAASDLYREVGLTAEAIAETVAARLAGGRVLV